jgi:hypothetical protein
MVINPAGENGRLSNSLLTIGIVVTGRMFCDKLNTGIDCK